MQKFFLIKSISNLHQPPIQIRCYTSLNAYSLRIVSSISYPDRSTSLSEHRIAGPSRTHLRCSHTIDTMNRAHQQPRTPDKKTIRLTMPKRSSKYTIQFVWNDRRLPGSRSRQCAGATEPDFIAASNMQRAVLVALESKVLHYGFKGTR